MKYKRIRIILIAILAIVFAVSAFHIIKIIYDYKTADKANAQLQSKYVAPVETDNTLQKDPVPITVDFEALMQENEDVVGWLYCPDTPINYPVVKGEDNNEYLRADLQGKYLVSGTLFADYRNGNIGEDQNYIVYGHNMKNSAMFGTLVKYKEQSYYDAHPILYFLTPDNNYVLELCAGAVVKSDSDIYHPDPDETVITLLKANSSFHSTVEIAEGDGIITLSTCSYDFDDARYVLVGKLNKLQ